MSPPYTPATLADEESRPLTSWSWYQRIAQALPGMSASHPSQAKTAVYDDIRLLGALLGKVVATEPDGGRELFLLIETLRRKAKQARVEGTAISHHEVTALVATLAENQPTDAQMEKLLKVVDAFRIFLELASIAESFHQNQVGLHTLVQSIRQQAASGVALQQSLEALEKTSIRLVSTAHPTQIFRVTYLNHHKAVMELLGRFHEANSYDVQAQVIDELETEIQRLWLTGFVRWVKPDVLDEAKALHSFLDVLIETLPDLHQEITQSLKRIHQCNTLPRLDAPLIHIGSWIGGDMDGNPNALPHVLASILSLHRERVLTLYRDRLYALASRYSFSMSKGIHASPQLLASIEEDLDAFERVSDRPFKYSSGIYKYEMREPYRQKLLLMVARLNHTLSYPTTLSQLTEYRLSRENGFVPQPKSLPFVYASAQQLAEDIELLIESLKANPVKEEMAAPLQRLLQAIRVFKFCYTSVDLREDAAYVQAAAKCSLLAEGYDLSAFWGHAHHPDAEKAWAGFLEEQLQKPHTSAPQFRDLDRIIADQPQLFSENGQFEKRLFAMLAVAKLSQEEISTDTGKHLLLSMANSESDILAALLLLKLQGLAALQDGQLYGSVDIVPLFETIDDLQNAPAVMERLFQSQTYRQYLASRNHRQIVLMAYSDSNKDGGYLMSNWCLYKAQRDIQTVAERYGLQLQFYHGRGGSIGRGGGSSRHHILSLPAHSLDHGIQITEQGEVLAKHYLEMKSAKSHLGNLLAAAYERGLCDEKTLAAPPQHLELVEALAKTACSHYQQLIATPGFVEYFKRATPKEVETIHIGSRPAHRRKEATIKELRAIPWAFRWFQSRTIIPGWYGMGTAISQYIHYHAEGLITLQQAYQAWPFFKGLMNNSAVTLLQSDMQIAAHYKTLAETDETDAALMTAIFQLIADEYELTKAMFQQVMGGEELLQEPDTRSLRESIEMKRTYLDPLNYLQVHLLKRFRAEGDTPDEKLQSLYHRAFISSTGGLVAGLGTSG